jgi:hypothetical protein
MLSKDYRLSLYNKVCYNLNKYDIVKCNVKNNWFNLIGKI